MKITGIERFPVTYTLARPGAPVAGRMARQPFDSVLIRVHADNGMYGVGEAPSHRVYLGDTNPQILKTLDQIEEVIVGQSPWNIARIHKRILETGGGVAARLPNAARAAVDMALYDLMGKESGRPVHELLNGGMRRTFEIFGTEYSETLEDKKAILTKFINKGYVGAEVKVPVLQDEISLVDVQKKAQMLREIMEFVPSGFEVMADCNLRWGPAANVISMIKGFNLEQYCNLMIEQPVSYFDLSGMQKIREAIACPIIADESSMAPDMVFQLARLQAADIICIKLPRVGGLYPAKQIIAVAEAAGLGIKTDTGVHGHIADTATVHLASCTQMPHPVADGWTWLEPDCAVGGVQIENGRVTLPEAPGLGVDLDVAMAKKIAWQP